MARATVKTHTRKTKSGKTVVVKQHTKHVDKNFGVIQSKKLPTEVNKRERKKISPTELSKKAVKIATNRIEDKKQAKKIVTKYKDYPHNLSVMTNAKWRNELVPNWRVNKKGERERFMSVMRKLNFTEQQFADLMKENGGLIHKIVSSKSSYNPEIYDDLKQAANLALYEAVNNYESKYNPKDPYDIQRHISSHINGYVSAEMAKQVATRFRLPHQKLVLYNKFRNFYDEYSGDYNKIYNAMKLTKKDLYPSIESSQANDLLPRDGYVTLVKESVLDKKTALYESKINDLKDKYENEKNLLAGRLHGATDEDREAYDSAERIIDKEIEVLTNKVSDKKTPASKRLNIEERINELENRKKVLATEIKPITEEEYQKEVNAIAAKNQSDIKALKDKYTKDIGKTSVQGAYNLFNELEQIMSFKDFNLGKTVEFGGGEKVNLEEIISKPNQVSPHMEMEIKTDFVFYKDQLEQALDSLEPRTSKVIKMHLGLDKSNELYAHGLWGVPMEAISEIARELPKDFYPRLDVASDSDFKDKVAKWKAKKPQRVLTVKRNATEVNKQKAKLKEWTKNRKKAKAFISKRISKIKGMTSKAKFRTQVYKKYKAELSKKPTNIMSKQRKLTDRELKAMTAKWKKSKPTEKLSERSLFSRIKNDIAYGKMTLQTIYPVSAYKRLMRAYDDMRAYNIRKASLKDDLKKSMVVDRFFGVKVIRQLPTEEDSIIKKAYNKIKGLFKLLG